MIAQKPGSRPWGLYSPMNVADNCNRRADMYNVRLSHEHLLGFLADFTQQRLVEQLLPQQLLYAGIEVEGSHDEDEREI